MPGTFLLHSCTGKAAKICRGRCSERQREGERQLGAWGRENYSLCKAHGAGNVAVEVVYCVRLNWSPKTRLKTQPNPNPNPQNFSPSTLVWASRRRCAVTALSRRCHCAAVALLSAYQKGNYEPHCKGNKSKAQTNRDGQRSGH